MWYQILFGLYFVIFNVVNAQTLGGDCRTPLNEKAKCIGIYECKTFLPLIISSTRTPEQTKFLQASSCGFDSSNVPYVCCGTKISNVVDTNSEDSNAPFTPNPLIPDRENCGFQFINKIFGGQATALDEFPWMAVLQFSTDSGHRRFQCGGFLINPRYILTAAHCVVRRDDDISGKLVNIRLGEYDISSPGRDCVVNKGIRSCNQEEVNAAIDEIIPHPGFNIRNKSNNIALVRLASEVRYSEFIQPGCLPLPNEGSLPGENLVIAGWGKTENGTVSDVKRKLEVKVVDESKCAEVYRPSNIKIQKSHICAGGEKGKNPCAGDSGGPLMRTLTTDNTRWMVEGVSSFGRACGTANYPEVYTRVSKYVPWIHKNVRA